MLPVAYRAERPQVTAPALPRLAEHLRMGRSAGLAVFMSTETALLRAQRCHGSRTHLSLCVNPAENLPLRIHACFSKPGFLNMLKTTLLLEITRERQHAVIMNK